jgi:hypothetical protein
MITLKITHQHITVILNISIIPITVTNNDKDIMLHTTTTHLAKSVHISSSVQQQIYYTKFSFSWGEHEGREVILVMLTRMEWLWVSGERECYLLSFLLILSFITAAASHLVLSIYRDSPIQQQSNYLYLSFLWRLVYCRLVRVVTCNIGECAVRWIEDSSYSIGDVMNAWYGQHQQTIISR